MAPEQAEGTRVTWEADVYSLALSLYEAWTGVNPVRRRGPAATARQLGKPITSLGRMRRDVPPELVAAIDLALDPRPERRPGPEELAGVLRDHAPELSDEGALEEDELRERPRRRPRVVWRARMFAGVTAGLLALAVLELFSPPMTFSPAAAAVIVVLTVALLPRLGWIASTLVLCGWLASPAGARDGMAAVLLAVCLPVPFLLARSPASWSVPGFAPLLAAAGAGPAYAAVAGQATTWGRRAALGAIGWLWIAVAEAAIRAPLVFGLADGQRERSYWMHDGWRALSHAVAPAFASATALTALAFAVAAAVLPVLVRGLRLPLDLIAAGLWAGALYAALAGLEQLAGTGVHARGAATGALLAAAIAVAAAAYRRSRHEGALGPDIVP
jgi:hypothetical protein